MDTPPPLDSERCIITGKYFPKSMMIHTEHGWVSAEGRDTYYQCLREKVPFPAVGGASTARAEGKNIVVPTSNPALPLRCVKTNQPVEASQLKKKTLYWAPPWLLITILLSILVYLILYLCMRKKVVVEIPLSPRGRAIVRNNTLLAVGLLLGGLFVAFWGGFRFNSGLMILLGIVTAVVGVIWAVLKGNALRIAKYNSIEVSLAGACPEYLASLTHAPAR